MAKNEMVELIAKMEELVPWMALPRSENLDAFSGLFSRLKLTHIKGRAFSDLEAVDYYLSLMAPGARNPFGYEFALSGLKTSLQALRESLTSAEG